jgi:hypothetical protein
MAVDTNDNLYVADYNNHLIRKITPSGVVTTLAGTGSSGSTNGLATMASFNNPTSLVIDSSGIIYVADTGNHLIRKIDPSGQVSTFAGTGSTGHVDDTGLLASFNNPKGISLDILGNLYVADLNNYKIHFSQTERYRCGCRRQRLCGRSR